MATHSNPLTANPFELLKILKYLQKSSNVLRKTIFLSDITCNHLQSVFSQTFNKKKEKKLSKLNPNHF